MTRDDIVAVLATGPSMSQEVADSVRSLRVIAVSNAYTLAPWAEALVSGDAQWWEHHTPAWVGFKGRKFSSHRLHGIEQVRGTHGWHSGMVAVRVAFDVLGARRILLLGFDMRGGHFFGSHPSPLKNPGPGQFARFQLQFAKMRIPVGVEVINCTPGSALSCFPRRTLAEALEIDETPEAMQA